MAKFTVLLVAPNDLTRRLTVDILEVYDHAAITAEDEEGAKAILQSDRKVHVLIVDADAATDELNGLALARFARGLDPKLMVIYTSRRPQGILDKSKVAGAPMLRTPFFPHQVTGLISELRTGATRSDAQRFGAPSDRQGSRLQVHASRAFESRAR